jgi:hypothetical protein
VFVQAVLLAPQIPGLVVHSFTSVHDPPVAGVV